MTMDEINKFLTETMGECWHQRILLEKEEGANPATDFFSCVCGKDPHLVWPDWYRFHKNNDFFTWEGFGKLREYMQKENLYCAFHEYHCFERSLDLWELTETPGKFAKAIHAYLKDLD